MVRPVPLTATDLTMPLTNLSHTDLEYYDVSRSCNSVASLSRDERTAVLFVSQFNLHHLPLERPPAVLGRVLMLHCLPGSMLDYSMELLLFPEDPSPHSYSYKVSTGVYYRPWSANI